jgi:peptidyl-prolyl cis-trans isomerase A (cyclophilin A)
VIPDDPVRQSNTKGRITFATGGPNTRTTQLFINLVDNPRLDGSGFAPFGEVVSGMNVVESLYGDYGEGAPGGLGPRQDLIQAQGNAYLEKDFPRLDYIKKASVQ